MILRLGAAVKKQLTKGVTQVKFKIVEETETEKYLGDIIGNLATEEDTFNKLLEGIERLGAS